MAKVWHISRFRQRYELPDDIRYDRDSPLKFTKEFVGSGNDDESCAFWRQIIALRSKQNYLTLRGAFTDLKSIAGNMSKEFRGYLLDSNFKPASVKEIGSWLGKGEKKAARLIKELSDVGLLELVTLPNFNGAPVKSVRKRKGPGKSGRTRKRTEKSGKSQKLVSVRARKRTGNSGTTRNPFKKKAKAKANGNEKVNKELKRQDEDKAQDRRATQPFKPQVSAKGGQLIQFNAPPELKNTERLGIIAEKILHRYSPASKEFAFEIYRALKLPWEPDSEEGKRELGCFASVWQNVGTSSSVLDELRVRAIDEAKKISNRRQNRKKGAVWCTVFKNLEAAYGRRNL